MVAVRMRVTGNSQADIEATLRQCAPTLREKPEGREQRQNEREGPSLGR